MLNVLVGCEYSGTVREAFKKLGHNAWSCDLLPTEIPGNHYQLDLIKVCELQKWDLLIAHPPCTYLTNSGVRWLYNKDGSRNKERWENLNSASSFFKEILYQEIPYICVENPIPHKYADIRKYDQIIQPWQFGHPESKATCLWLKGLPKLEPTNVLSKPSNGRWNNQTPSGQNNLGPSADRWKIRSKTYQEIANAMAKQWSKYIEEKHEQE